MDIIVVCFKLEWVANEQTTHTITLTMITMGKSKTKREKKHAQINDKYKQCEGDEFLGFGLE